MFWPIFTQTLPVFHPAGKQKRRFVSLLPFQRRPAVGDQRLQNWNSPHTFLAAGRGDCSDHALLLCSLLLGFGLDAFVCVGHVKSVESDGHAGADRMGIDDHLRQPEANHLVRAKRVLYSYRWRLIFNAPSGNFSWPGAFCSPHGLAAGEV